MRQRSPHSRLRSRWICAGLIASTVLAAAVAPGISAPVRSATDDQVRSAFLYQLAQYISWPKPKTGDPLRFCVLGDDDLAASLDPLLRGKAVQGRPVTVSRLTGPAQLADCELAFLGLTKRKQLRELFTHWNYPPVLLVGEVEGFAELGGMVNLNIDSGRVTVEVNLSTCRKAGLELRSQLLRLARIVSSEGAPPDGRTP